jgi:putative hydrolase of the HAD superfamily
MSGLVMPKSHFSHVESWVFDMDHTLYPADNSLFSQIEERMSAYFKKLTGLPAEHADNLRLKYWQDYGASVAGLVANHDVDAAEFLHEVHQIDFSVLSPNMTLNQAISALPGRKIVFTNGPKDYAHRVLAALEMTDLFDGVFGTEHCDLIPKPQRRAYEIIFNTAMIDTGTSAMFEDSAHNLIVPHEMGMKTVLVHGQSEDAHIHHHTSCLPSFLQSLI